MCGIIAAFSKKESVNEFVLNQYEDQHSRGTQGFGAVFIKDDGTYEVKRATEPIKALIDLNLTESKMIMFHHRYPTSSENKINQTHPLFVSNKTLSHDYLIIHNGVIYNDKELNTTHEGIGFSYRTKYTEDTTLKKDKFNDSESLAIEIARYLDGQTTEMDVKGSAAFVCLQIDKANQKVIKAMYGTNGGSPLKAHISPGKVFLSSVGIGTEVAKNVLYTINMKTLKVEHKPMVFAEEKVAESKIPKFEEDDDYGYKNNVGRGYPLQTRKDFIAETAKAATGTTIDFSAYDKSYADIIEEGHEEIETILAEYYDFIQNPTYTNDEEVSDAVQKLTRALYRMEARALDRSEDVEEMESYNSSYIPQNVGLKA